MPTTKTNKQENAKRAADVSCKQEKDRKMIAKEGIALKMDFESLLDDEYSANAFTQFYREDVDEEEEAKPSDSKVQRLLNKYEHRKAIEFAAYTKIWDGESKQKPSKLPRCSRDLKIIETDIPNMAITRAYYRVIVEKEDKYILMACHVNVHGFHRGDLRFVEVDDRTMLTANDGFSVIGRLFLGDVVAVTHLIRTSNTLLCPQNVLDVSHQTKCSWAVLNMTVLPRNEHIDVNFAMLDNGTAVAQGHDESLTILTSSVQLKLNKIYKGNAFVPEKFEYVFCRNHHSKHKNSLIDTSSAFQSISNALGTIYKVEDAPEATKMFEIGVNAFRNQENSDLKPEEIVETCVLMGYSAANTIFNGRSDSRMFPMKNIEKSGLIVKFSIANPKKQPTNGKWMSNMRITLNGKCGRLTATIETAVLEADGNQLRIVARISRDSPKNIDFKDGVYVVAQREVTEAPLLRNGFFDKMPGESNGKRIIETLYGGPPMGLEAQIEKESFQFPSQPPVSLNEFQNEYVSMVLAGTPMVVASSPFGCGKSMTIVTAVIEMKKLEPRRQQLLVTQSNYAGVNLVDIASKISDSDDIKVLRFVSEKNWKELADDCHTKFDMPTLMQKEFVEWALGRGPDGISYHQTTTIIRYVIAERLLSPTELEGYELSVYSRLSSKQKTRKPRSKDLMEAFFEIYQPDVIVTTADSLQGLMSAGVLETISTIQIDEASQVPEYIIFNLLSSYPNASFGMIGDIHQLPPYCEDELKGKLKDYGIGNTMERAIEGKMFPQAILRCVYRCHPETTKLLSELFYDGQLISGVTKEMKSEFVKNHKDFWPNPEYPMIIVDNQEPGYKMGTSCANRAEVTLVKQIVEHITKEKDGYRIRPEDVGVISFYSAQTSVLTEAMRGSGVKCGTVDAFQGSEREVIIVCCTNERLSEFMQLSNRLNVAMSRAKQATIVIGNIEGMRNAKYWSTIVKRAEEHGCLVDTLKISPETYQIPAKSSGGFHGSHQRRLTFSLNNMTIKEQRNSKKSKK